MMSMFYACEITYSKYLSVAEILSLRQVKIYRQTRRVLYNDKGRYFSVHYLISLIYCYKLRFDDMLHDGPMLNIFFALLLFFKSIVVLYLVF